MIVGNEKLGLASTATRPKYSDKNEESVTWLKYQDAVRSALHLAVNFSACKLSFNFYQSVIIEAVMMSF